MKKTNAKRGFTLVELIVVLVILAVLAALLVPALTGYIDKARKSQVVAETRMLHTAIQTEMSELYAKPAWQNYQQDLPSGGIVIASKTTNNATTDNVTLYANIAELSEVPSLQNGKSGSFGGYVLPNGRLHFLMYYNGDGYIGLYFAESGEYMALKTGTEAPDYTHYLLDNQLRCVSNVDYKGDPNVYLSKNMILYTIGYLSEYKE